MSMINHPPIKIFSTKGSKVLAEKIYENLRKFPLLESSLGMVDVTWFPNQNIQLQIDDVRDRLAVVIHTQSPPVSDGTIELFALLDAISNASPADVLLVFPYMPYVRSDRKDQPRISVMGFRLPHILNNSFGIKRVILLDPHDVHVKHYFYPVADEITAMYLMINYLKKYTFLDANQVVIVFADVGAIKRYEKIAHLLGLPSAFIEKYRRDDNEKPEIKRIIGNVKDCICIVVDDEILTGGTAIGDVEALLDEGAKRISDMVAIHPIIMSEKLSEEELMRKLAYSPVERFIFTDSIIHDWSKMEFSFPKFTFLSIAPLLAEAIKRSAVGESLTELHKLESVKLYYP